MEEAAIDCCVVPIEEALIEVCAVTIEWAREDCSVSLNDDVREIGISPCF